VVVWRGRTPSGGRAIALSHARAVGGSGGGGAVRGAKEESDEEEDRRAVRKKTEWDSHNRLITRAIMRPLIQTSGKRRFLTRDP
jgi:hypothetical protein